jgi:hypothetical protein
MTLDKKKCFNAKECKRYPIFERFLYDGLQIPRQAHALQKKKQGNHLKQMNLSRHTMCLSAVFHNGSERIIRGSNTIKLFSVWPSTKIIFYESTQERQNTGR